MDYWRFPSASAAVLSVVFAAHQLLLHSTAVTTPAATFSTLQHTFSHIEDKCSVHTFSTYLLHPFLFPSSPSSLRHVESAAGWREPQSECAPLHLQSQCIQLATASCRSSTKLLCTAATGRSAKLLCSAAATAVRSIRYWC